jgi:beta-N-acetylhexosaminidase
MSRLRRAVAVAGVAGLAITGPTAGMSGAQLVAAGHGPDAVRVAAPTGPDGAAGPALPLAGTAPPTAASPAGRPGGPGDAELRKVIRKMTLEEKVGQLFVVQIFGHSADTADPAAVAKNRELYGVDNAAQLVAKYPVGGIIYYGDNVRDPQQVAAFSNGIQRAALSTPRRLPLLLSIDQEGGIVARLGPPFTPFPGAMALGAGRTPGDATAAARVTGRELRAIGIHSDYAPVADVNVNPANPVIGVRSFGSDPAMVSDMVTAQISGYDKGGVTATAKHFPGHGDTAVDSHTGVPEITHSREEWERLDLPPFRAAIKRGVESMMTAHLIVPALDPSRDPATLSRPILTGILREQLGYDGVITTDALDMQGVRDKYGDDRVPVLALKAGADQLLKPPTGTFELQYNAVLAAVRGGELSERAIDRSVLRVLRQKAKRDLFDNPLIDEGKVGEIVGAPEHQATSQRVTDPGTTLVKNDAGTLPLAKDGRKVLVTGWGVATTQTLAEAIGRRGPATSVLETGLSPDQAKIDAAVAQAGANDLTIVATNRAWDVAAPPGHNGPGQSQLVKALLATGKPVIVVAVRDAYDIGHFTEAPTYVATFSYTPQALESLARVLFAENDPRGRLPVKIPPAGQPGETLYPYGHGLGY